MNTIELAVKNLEVLSEALEKASMNPKHYNSDFSYYLEQISWSMYRDAQELKERSFLFGDY